MLTSKQADVNLESIHFCLREGYEILTGSRLKH